MARPTLKDVARAAGVSVTTVSVVLNDKHDGVRVPPATRERVRQVAEELGYRPNQMARGLRQRTSRAIGFLSDEVTTTPFAVGMLAAAQETAAEQGYLLFVVNVLRDNGSARLQPALDLLVEHQVTQFVVASMYHRAVEPVETLPPSTVFLNAFPVGAAYASIVPDERTAARTAVTELFEHGHRRVAFLDDSAGTVASPLRYQGYLDAHAELDLEPDPRLHLTLPPATPGASHGDGLLDLPDDVRPTGIFCFNDRAAMGLYRAARARGLRIPDDLSVIGFDDQEYIAPELEPALTTMRLPHQEMGRLAIAAVLGLDENRAASDPGGDEDGQISLVECPLIRRDSVASV
jgi:LacI family transcriptional regulator